MLQQALQQDEAAKEAVRLKQLCFTAEVQALREANKAETAWAERTRTPPKRKFGQRLDKNVRRKVDGKSHQFVWGKVSQQELVPHEPLEPHEPQVLQEPQEPQEPQDWASRTWAFASRTLSRMTFSLGSAP